MPTTTPDYTRLRAIKTFPQLVKYLREELDWPIQTDDFDELTFDYSPEELGLENTTAAKIKEIKQLRPLSSKQPWGVFFVNFEPKKLPVVALRRILSTLVVKKRSSANKSQQAAWKLHDLLFVSSYGESEHREITFAHFSDESGQGDIPTLRVLGWDDENTALHLEHTHKELSDKLRWPTDENDPDAWREKWSSAFTLRNRQVISTSRDLAERLADLASRIRKRANAVLRLESDKGPLRKLHAAFKEALIHDLSEDDFADMYAQTISYGLLTARVSRPEGLVANNLSDMVPVTNPFLKDLLQTFLTAGGRKGKIDFDELGISEVVQLLRDADMEAVLRDFGDRNPQEDPAIHFYELFLKEYDAHKRMQRGVFYTPRPVVSFIVRSVHEILQKEFGLEDGLADTTTWNEMLTRHRGLRPPEGISLNAPFVQILDPATGTGTFLVEAIDVIHRTMEAKWKRQGHMPLEFERLWNEYVPKHLLPRLHGFELMMAPYAIAHMKFGLKLHETGYRFGAEQRARIYLTNSLEPPGNDKKQREFEEWAPALAHEAKAVDIVKKTAPITVILGNPPYSNYGMLNKNSWILSLLEDFKTGLDEKKLNLDDDFIKFTRYAQWRIESSGIGILAFISNHIYVTGLVHRRMRRSLMETFHRIMICDLHGNSKKGEVSPTGARDENVFDIQQGVAIGILRRGPLAAASSTVCHSELWGSRESKYDQLTERRFGDLAWRTVDDIDRTSCLGAFWFFEPRASLNIEEYCHAWSLKDIFITSGQGVKTERDPSEIRNVIEDFRTLDEPTLRNRYSLQEDSRDWKIGSAKQDVLSNIGQDLFRKILYRPFDVRYTWYSGQTRGFIGTPGRQTMIAMFGAKNIGLVVPRQVTGSVFSHVFCSRLITEIKLCSHDRASSLFPLYANADETAQNVLFNHSGGQRCNLSPDFVAVLTSCLAEAPSAVPRERSSVISPEHIFSYLYAVLHSPAFRTRYVEFLKTDYARVPLTRSVELFIRLAQIGAELSALHLLESPMLNASRNSYQGRPNPEVERVFYAVDTVWIDKAHTAGFRGVNEATWSFDVGGYQVCEKWLKDRKGRKLSRADIEHYQKIVVALSETIRLMAEVDNVIDTHGGWPSAFALGQKPANKATSH